MNERAKAAFIRGFLVKWKTDTGEIEELAIKTQKEAIRFCASFPEGKTAMILPYWKANVPFEEWKTNR